METLHTPRLTLRPWRDDDAAALFRLASDPLVGPLAGWPPHQSEEESLQVIRLLFSNDHTWAIELTEDGNIVGCIGYYTHGESNIGIGPCDAEPGYWIGRPWWNRGFATEALTALIDYCFRTKHFRTLWCDCLPDNTASRRVMEKCGFTDAGRSNLISRLALSTDTPVAVMRLDAPRGYTTHYTSPLGEMRMLSDGENLCALWFAGQHHEPADKEYIEANNLEVFRTTRRWLDTYFAGLQPTDAPPLHPTGSTFAQRVWRELQTLPYGSTASYGELARRVGCRSAQAVGGAVGRNPIALIVPCHRVVGAGGSLTGYAAGIWRKEFLLNLEKQQTTI